MRHCRTATVAALLALVACAPPTPTPAPLLVPGQQGTATRSGSATPTPSLAGVPVARATFANPFTPTPAPDVASGGLGLRRRDWEARHAGASFRAEYRDDRVVAIERAGDRAGWAIDAARRDIVQNVAPRDASYLRTETRPDGSVVDRFTSPSLGGFAAVYEIYGDGDRLGRVSSYRVATGEPAPITVGHAGQAVESGGVAITASAPRRVAALVGWGQPSEGKMFVVVDVEVRTVARDSFTFNARDFELRDSQGRVHRPTIGRGGSLGEVKVVRGAVAQGDVSFETPTDAHGFLLTYQRPLGLLEPFEPIRVAIGDP